MAGEAQLTYALELIARVGAVLQEIGRVDEAANRAARPRVIKISGDPSEVTYMLTSAERQFRRMYETQRTEAEKTRRQFNKMYDDRRTEEQKWEDSQQRAADTYRSRGERARHDKAAGATDWRHDEEAANIWAEGREAADAKAAKRKEEHDAHVVAQGVAKQYAESPEGQREHLRRQWTSEYMTGMGDKATSSGAAAYVAAKFADLAKRTEEVTKAMTPMQQMWELIGKGYIRRGIATGVTGALGGGVEAQLIGGFAGAVGSAIAMPIAFAVASALSEIPRHVGEVVDWQRYAGQLPAGSANFAGGEAWRQNVGDVRHFFGNMRNPGGEKMHDVILKAAMQARQAGPLVRPGDDETAIAKRTQAYLAQAAVLDLAGYGKTGDIAATMSQLDTSMQVDPARKAMLSQPWMQEAWKRKYAKNMTAWQAQAYMEQSLATPEAVNPQSPTGAAAIKNLVQEEVTTNPRMKGILEQQQQMWRLSPKGNWFSRDAGDMTSSEESYVERMKTRLGMDLTIWTADDRDEWINKLKQKSAAKGGYMGEGVISPERQAELDRIARGERGQWWQVPGLGDPGGMKTNNKLTSQYQWTSFSGLAEQMQQMWSGAPPIDANTDAVTKNTAAVEDLTNILSGKRGQPQPDAAVTPPA